jgi:hypothetical protein
MQYRVQFLDRMDNVIREVRADGRSTGSAFLRAANLVWPPHVVRVRVIGPSGRVSTSKVLARLAA